MNVPFPIELPSPPGTDLKPIWTGRGFLVGEKFYRVLSYGVGVSGWTDDLTELHEGVDDEDHYMNLASRIHAISQLERYLECQAPVIIEIGSSSGFMIKDLRRRMPHARIVGSDYVLKPLEELGTRISDVPLLQFDLLNCPLPDEGFHAAVLLNVLEHISDDNRAIQEIYRFLKPGGIAVIEVPAGRDLFDIYDRQLLHHRRYQMTALLAQLRSAGFKVRSWSHLGFFFYPGFWFVKKRNRRFLDKPVEVQRAMVERSMRQLGHSKVMSNLMSLELKLGEWVRYPIGIRCVVTCQKQKL
jgi:SAM-dependent methyltransferase